MRVFILPAVQSRSGEGVTPWSGAPEVGGGHARRPNLPADGARSHGCGTTCTTAADAPTRPDRRYPEPAANAATPGSGRPPSPACCTARTTDARTGSDGGCSATEDRTHSSPASPAAHSPHAHASDSVPRSSARGTRGQSMGGGVCAERGTSELLGVHHERALVLALQHRRRGGRNLNPSPSDAALKELFANAGDFAMSDERSRVLYLDGELCVVWSTLQVVGSLTQRLGRCNRLPALAPDPTAPYRSGLRRSKRDNQRSAKELSQRLRAASQRLREATKAEDDPRTAAREFLAALAELIACLLRFLVRMLILLLSRLLGRAAADDVPVWKPDPIDTTPQITPRGPNPIFPVFLHRGGFRRSALGSVVLAA